MSIPSWAVKGAKVVCVRTMPAEGRIVGAVYPEIGSVYTIRAVVLTTIGKHAGEPSLLLEEIVNVTSINKLAFGVESDREASMPIDAFRPLITQEDDLKAHFNKHLHQRASRKTEERV